MARCKRCSVNCIVPPHVLKRLLQNPDKEIREAALNTLLATTSLRAERRLLATIGFLPSVAGGKRRTIYDCKRRLNLDAAKLVRGETDPAIADDSVSRAFDGLGDTYDFYQEVFKRNSIDDRGMRLDGYVHYGHAYNNAFWNGRQMVFGDGDGKIFTDFTKSVDVIAHELTHGVTEASAGLEYHNQSGALNESISDVFGSLAKQWSAKEQPTAGQADWLIGTDVFTPDIEADALRSLKAPGQAYDNDILGRDPQPAHMDNYDPKPDTEDGDWGGVHINSGIPNHAFYLVAVGIGGNAWEAPGRIWYEALRASNPKTDFQEFANRTYTTAGHLYGSASKEQQAVLAGWSEVGIGVRDARVAAVAAPGAGRLAAAMSGGATGNGSDGWGNVSRQLENLGKEIRALRKDVDQMKQRPKELAKG